MSTCVDYQRRHSTFDMLTSARLTPLKRGSVQTRDSARPRSLIGRCRMHIILRASVVIGLFAAVIPAVALWRRRRARPNGRARARRRTGASRSSRSCRCYRSTRSFEQRTRPPWSARSRGACRSTRSCGASWPCRAHGTNGAAAAQGAAGAEGAAGAQGATGASPFLLSGNDALYTAGNVGIGATAASPLKATLDVRGTFATSGNADSIKPPSRKRQGRLCRPVLHDDPNGTGVGTPGVDPRLRPAIVAQSRADLRSGPLQSRRRLLLSLATTEDVGKPSSAVAAVASERAPYRA